MAIIDYAKRKILILLFIGHVPVKIYFIRNNFHKLV